MPGIHLTDDLLTRDWEEVQGSLPRFIEKLSDLALLPEEGGRLPSVDGKEPMITAGVTLPVGEVAEDADTQEPVAFPVNAAGGSPHIALMGGAGSGKTRTAATMLKRLRSFGALPLLAFDFKGDLASTYGLDVAFGGQVIAPPRAPVPLDVLAVADTDDIAMMAVRIRESIGRVKSRAISGIQADALRDAVLQVLRTRHPATLNHISTALTVEYNRRNRRPDELTATLNDLTQFTLFEPRYSPAEFFQRSWLISLPPDIPSDVQRLVTNLTLDALDRWINNLPEALLVDGRRSLRHVCLIDEAHLILASGLPALGNLVRMSRSKGGLIVLVSQSPNDFENEDDAFLDNVGLTVAFNTNATVRADCANIRARRRPHRVDAGRGALWDTHGSEDAQDRRAAPLIDSVETTGLLAPGKSCAEIISDDTGLANRRHSSPDGIERQIALRGLRRLREV
jgi:hypothetical protein